MPARKLEILIGAAYRTSSGNWERKALYLNNFAWKQVLMGDEERSVKSIDKVNLNQNDETVIITYNDGKTAAFKLRLEAVTNSGFGNGMVYFYISSKLSKWSAN